MWTKSDIATSNRPAINKVSPILIVLLRVWTRMWIYFIIYTIYIYKHQHCVRMCTCVFCSIVYLYYCVMILYCFCPTELCVRIIHSSGDFNGNNINEALLPSLPVNIIRITYYSLSIILVFMAFALVELQTSTGALIGSMKQGWKVQ